MTNSKLILLLRSFSKEELKEFQNFVDSPYFNREKSISRLVAEVKKELIYPKESNLLKEGIFKRVYPERVYSDDLMRNIVSKTLKLAEEFVTNREFQSEHKS
jgi:hypothetical protein